MFHEVIYADETSTVLVLGDQEKGGRSLVVSLDTEGNYEVTKMQKSTGEGLEVVAVGSLGE